MPRLEVLKWDSKLLKVGLRKSKLSLCQGDILKSYLPEVELCGLKTDGDAKQTSLSETDSVGRDKKDWIQGIEEKIVSGEIDLGLHSAKDIPAKIDAATGVVSILERRWPGDLLIGCSSLEDLPKGARVGTASLRRQMQLRVERPDLELVTLRGNIDSRLNRFYSGEFVAIVLAEAGVRRLGLELKDSYSLPVERFVPAVNQGILACQYRLSLAESASSDSFRELSGLSIPDVEKAFRLERQVISELEADCSSALGVHYSQGLLSVQIFGCQSGKSLEESRTIDTEKELTSFVDNLKEKGAISLLKESRKL